MARSDNSKSRSYTRISLCIQVTSLWAEAGQLACTCLKPQVFCGAVRSLSLPLGQIKSYFSELKYLTLRGWGNNYKSVINIGGGVVNVKLESISRFELTYLLTLNCTNFRTGPTDLASTKVQHRMATQNHPAYGYYTWKHKKCARVKWSCSLICNSRSASALSFDLNCIHCWANQAITSTLMYFEWTSYRFYKTMVSLVKVWHVHVFTHPSVGV